MADRSGLSIEGKWENGLMEGEMKIETDEGILNLTFTGNMPSKYEILQSEIAWYVFGISYVKVYLGNCISE